MIKNLLAFFIIFSLCSTTIFADDVSTIDTTKSFNDYANGAMSVYTKFKQPSKEQSEKFFAFVKTKWQSSQCSVNCSTAGENAGKEYAYTMNVPMDN